MLKITTHRFNIDVYLFSPSVFKISGNLFHPPDHKLKSFIHHQFLKEIEKSLNLAPTFSISAAFSLSVWSRRFCVGKRLYSGLNMSWLWSLTYFLMNLSQSSLGLSFQIVNLGYRLVWLLALGFTYVSFCHHTHNCTTAHKTWCQDWTGDSAFSSEL